ncbi:MAG: flavin reductase family protein [Acidimicrobiales bacterium]
MTDAPVTANAAMVAGLDYPMFVVTAAAADKVSGCLAGFVSQCSIDPPRYVVCISRENHTFPVAARSAGLGLHLLGTDQHALASLFGELTGDHADKLARVAWRPGATGAPLLAACAAWVEGRVLDRLDLGDHVGHLIEPIAGGRGDHPGQLHLRQVRDLDPGHPV